MVYAVFGYSIIHFYSLNFDPPGHSCFIQDNLHSSEWDMMNHFFYKMICIKPALSRRCFLDCSEFRINLLCQEYFSMLFEPAVYKHLFDLLSKFWRPLYIYIHTSCWNERPRRWQRWWWRYWPCSTPPRPHSRSRCPWSAPDMFMTREAAGRDGIIFVLNITSWGGTPSVIVLKSTFWYDSMQGRTKNIPIA